MPISDLSFFVAWDDSMTTFLAEDLAPYLRIGEEEENPDRLILTCGGLGVNAIRADLGALRAVLPYALLWNSCGPNNLLGGIQGSNFTVPGDPEEILYRTEGVAITHEGASYDPQVWRFEMPWWETTVDEDLIPAYEQYLGASGQHLVDWGFFPTSSPAYQRYVKTEGDGSQTLSHSNQYPEHEIVYPPFLVDRFQWLFLQTQGHVVNDRLEDVLEELEAEFANSTVDYGETTAIAITLGGTSANAATLAEAKTACAQHQAKGGKYVVLWGKSETALLEFFEDARPI